MTGFLRRWRGETAPQQHEASSLVEPGCRVYCVGDVHGRCDLLRELHRLIVADGENFDGQKSLVYLGDYIDRGMESREVIDELLGAPLDGFETVHLMGNHEQTLLDFLQHPEAVAGWLAWGGRETLVSYGVTVPPGFGRMEMAELRDELEARIPPHHLEFIGQMPLTHVTGDYVFVHAGIRPGVPLEDQRAEDLMWIRHEFTGSTEQHGHVVVHGHSISEEVENLPNRIGIDTGAFYTGVLTCLVLEGGDRRFLQTGKGQ